MFRIIAHGPFTSLSCRWTTGTRLIVPQVEAAIEVAWRDTLARPGVRLFDGPVCRLESIDVRDGVASVGISRTSYKVVVGTNFANPNLADVYGANVLANPLGVSTALLTCDDYLMLGVRNHTVAYYPGRVHPFAGSVEVRAEVDLYHDARRELFEELALVEKDLSEVACVGFVEDVMLRHPESVFCARTLLSRSQIEAQTHADEHTRAWSTRADADGLAKGLSDTALTPVAQASLLLSGRAMFGAGWFAKHAVGRVVV